MELDELALARYIEAVRADGRHTSWGYHSRASVAHRYVAMTVPKVACTTFKMALQTWEGCGPEHDRWGDVHAGWAGPALLAYPTAQIVEMLRSPDFLRFSFVRNPYSRLVSAWKSKLAWDDPQYERLRASIREACGYPFADGQRAGPVAFRDAVECLLGDPAAFDDHWIRQVDLLVADVIDYHIVGRFERFGQDFHAILRRLHAPAEVASIARRVYNSTRPMALTAVYDPPLAGRVYSHYTADFETFGYHQNSWRFVRADSVGNHAVGPDLWEFCGAEDTQLNEVPRPPGVPGQCQRRGVPGQDLIAVRGSALPGIQTNGNPVTVLLSRPCIQGGEYSPTAPADTGEHPEHQPPADSGTQNGGCRGGDVTDRQTGRTERRRVWLVWSEL